MRHSPPTAAASRLRAKQGENLAKYQAAGALHNLAFNNANAAAIAEVAGGIEVFEQFVRDGAGQRQGVGV